MSACNDDCIKGTLAEGSPKGTIAQIGGVDAYFAKPAEKYDAAILICTDVFGSVFVNVQLIADAFAEHTGCLVVVPNMFGNDAVDPAVMTSGGFDFPTWLGKHHPSTKVHIIDAAVAELREKYGVKKIGAQGYCFGAKLVQGLVASGKVDAYSFAHPSFLKVPEDIETLKNTPGFWACAETDRIFSDADRIKTEEILKPTGKALFHLYPGTEHGFAVRAGEEKPKEAKQEALKEAIKFFKANLKA